MIDVNPNYLDTVTRILAGHVPECEVRAFGSRVTWTAKDYSDLDLAVVGERALDSDVLRRLKEAFEESDLPFRVDVLDWHAISPSFQKVIEKKYEVVQKGKKKSLGMAGDAWAERSVEEIKSPSANALATGPFGSAISSRHFVDHGVPVIRGGNLSRDVDIRLNDDGLVFVTEEKAKEFSRSLANRGDLIFTCWGTIDQVGLVDDRSRFREYVVSNKQMKLTPDPQKASALFLYYLFSSPIMRERILNQGIGSSVPGFNLGQLRSIRLDIPPLSEQRAIAHILGTLDDKIELNRRMNETLEAMARALFKSWFVDFDPVRAKAEGRDPGLPKPVADLFPESFEDSELGEIPKGWKIGRFGDVVKQLRDQENPLSSPDELFHHFSIPAFDEGQSPKPEYGESIKSLKSRVPAGVILLSKLNPEIERVWMVDVRPGERAVCSTEFLVLTAQSPFTRSYVYCLARSPLFRQQIEGLVTGTSKSHQRAQVDSILNLAVVVPPLSIVASFDHFVDSMLTRTLECRRETYTLAALRDTLLPKLISGELRVNDAERIIGRVS